MRVLVVMAMLLLGACSTPQPVGPRTDAGGFAEWVSLAPVPTPRSEVAAAAARGRIYVVGGFAENRGTVRTVEVYRIASDDWKTGPRLPVPLNHPMASSLGGKIYVLGGYKGPGLHDATDQAWVLHNGDWERLPDMPAARAAGGAVSARGKLFVVGGMKEHSPAHQTLVFNPETEKWKQISGLVTPRQHMGAAGFGGFVFGVGGRIGGLDGNMDAFERLNPRSRNWTELEGMPTARGGLGAAATRAGLIVAIGGEEDAGTFEEVEAYDTDSKDWSTLPDLPTPRHGLGVVAVGNKVFVLAGGPQPRLTFSDANEMLDLS